MYKDNCPYCNKEIEINHDDGYGYDEDKIYNQECEYCEKTFIYTTYIIVGHNLEKAPCLNGEKHNYELTHTYLKEFARLKCIICGEEK